jgi:SAM-dependent methyltransferase
MGASLGGLDPAGRFSELVEDYVRYRPGYPRELVEPLRRDCGLTADARIADVGCGPGNLAAVFLEYGNTVFGVEPNAAMREAGEKLLERFPRFHACDGRAEATGLPPASVDFVTAGQAFHWFEPEAARAEFRRILKPGGWVALVWNERVPESAFHDAYEALLTRHGVDYCKIRASRNQEASIVAFFDSAEVRRALFTHAQTFDFDGLRGRLLSSSYTPRAGHPAHEPMLAELRKVFEAYQKDGRVEFPYETTVWYGRLGGECGAATPC